MNNIPPSIDWDEEPPDIDFSMPDDPYPNDLDLGGLFDYVPDEDPFAPFPANDALESDLPTLPPTFDADDGWGWHDAALVAVERTTPDGEYFSIGAVDLYANVHSGDLGGSYLEMGTFDDIDEAAGYYHELQGAIHEQGLLPFQLIDFVGEKALERATERGEPAPEWRGAGDAEYDAYEAMQTLDAPDLPPDELELDAPEVETPAFKALRDIGIAADGFDPEADPPPFIDPDTGTAYWIGVFQPDKDDPDNAVTSILSLGRDPDTGEVEAQLAPVMPGDWNKAYSAAEYLLGVIEKGGIERAFETAEGMALATDQRDLWEAERGMPLAPDAAQDLADYTRDQWEIDL